MLRAMALDTWLDVGDPLAEEVVAIVRDRRALSPTRCRQSGAWPRTDIGAASHSCMMSRQSLTGSISTGYDAVERWATATFTMVRLNLLRADAWPLSGQPISALHTATGPLFFGAMILDRLRQLGATISPQEADGYYLIWRYTTRLVGVPQELPGTTAAEQKALDERVLPVSFNPDDNSRRLAAALITGLTTMPGTDRLPWQAHETLVRRMPGDERADAMGIPAHPIGTRRAHAAALGLRPYGCAQRMPAVNGSTERLGRRAARELVRTACTVRRPTTRPDREAQFLPWVPCV